jgi:hypothetical protein
MRRKQDGEGGSGGGGCQRGQELRPGQGIQGGHGLVQEQYLGRLGDSQRQSDLGVLATGESCYWPVEGHPEGG